MPDLGRRAATSPAGRPADQQPRPAPPAQRRRETSSTQGQQPEAGPGLAS